MSDRTELRADCANCFGLCCVAPAFAKSSDFAIDKKAGTPCSNLQADFRCGIHTELRPRGFGGCTVYDCFGAGQKVSQVTFVGQDWRRNPGAATSMFAVFTTMRHLHELLWYLSEALTFRPARAMRSELQVAFDGLDALTRGDPESLANLDVAPLRRDVSDLLLRASELVRAGIPGKKKDHRGADLIGAKFGAADLRGANLRGALLIGANLAGADLRLAEVIGADVRGADLRGAHLGECLYLIQAQLDAAKGDATTTLPSSLSRPAQWK